MSRRAPELYVHPLGTQVAMRREALEARRVDPPPPCGSLAELFLWQRQLRGGKDVVVAPGPAELELLMRAAGPLRIITPFGNLIIDYGEADAGT